MRDNFTPATKRILAGRAAYKCCYPGCNHVTIGPSTASNRVTNLGKAAHIHAASPGGPRYIPEMSKEERISLANGIWMCPTHADMIDADYTNYAAETLRLWKEYAEKEAHRLLMNLDKRTIHYPTTLVWLDAQLIFEGIWKTADDHSWTIVVKHFISGSIEELRDFAPFDRSTGMRRYIIIESQGDGRLLREGFTWSLNTDNDYEIKVAVFPKVARIDPISIGSDLADTDDGDILIADGDFKRISGKELALQIIRRILSYPFGTWLANPLVGSFFSRYFYAIEDKTLLNRFIKIEITRLITIPVYQFDPVIDPPELNFINRVLEVSVGPEENGFAPLSLSLEWGDSTTWSGTLNIRLHKNYTPVIMEEPPDEIKNFWNTLGK